MRGYIDLGETARKWSAKHLCLLALIAAIISFSLGCNTVIERGNPALPEGFKAAPLPDVPLNGYLYLDGSHFLGVKLKDLFPDYTPPVELSQDIGVTSLAVWVGPSVDAVGIGVRLANSELGLLIEEELEEASLQVRHFRRQGILYIVKGSGEWAEALYSSLKEERFVNMAEAYPKPWELMNGLPEAPLGHPVVAGFGVLDSQLLDRLERDVAANGGLLRNLMGAARLRHLAFALYSEGPLEGVPALDGSFLVGTGLSGVMVTRSSYPSFLVSLLFGNIASRSGLTKVAVEKPEGVEELFYLYLTGGTHFMVKNRGNVFSISLAPQKKTAEELIKSALK